MRDRQATVSTLVALPELEPGLSHTNTHALSCLPRYFLPEETLKLTHQVNEKMVSHMVKQLLSDTRATWFL